MQITAAGVLSLLVLKDFFLNVVFFSPLFLLAVLSDPQSRAIYDIYGKKGLEMEGWEVRRHSNPSASPQMQHPELNSSYRYLSALALKTQESNLANLDLVTIWCEPTAQTFHYQP